LITNSLKVVVPYLSILTLIFTQARVKTDTHHQTMSPSPPVATEIRILCLLARRNDYHARRSMSQDAWASADALNAGREGPQPPLQHISCTAQDAWKCAASSKDWAVSATTHVLPATRGHGYRCVGSHFVWRLAGCLISSTDQKRVVMARNAIAARHSKLAREPLVVCV
jgi:hypothetical protein